MQSSSKPVVPSEGEYCQGAIRFVAVFVGNFGTPEIIGEYVRDGRLGIEVLIV